MKTGKKIIAARKALGLTQQQVADALNVSYQAVSLWERGDSLPDARNLLPLSRILEISVDDLLSEDDPPAWELKSPTFSAEHMYTFVKAKAQAMGLRQTLAALTMARERHAGQVRKGIAEVPYVTHPLTLACHALAMGLTEDDVLATALLHDVVEDTGAKPEDLPVSERVREAVCLVSYNTCLKAGEDTNPEKKNEIKPKYYEGIRKNPLAALVKCIDRCNNLSCMADGFTKTKMRNYVMQTEQYVMPLLDVIREVPEYNNAAWLLRYQMTALTEAFKRLL